CSRDVRVSLNGEVVHKDLRTFVDLKSNFNIRIAMNNIGIDLHVRVSLIFIKTGNASHTLAQQLVAELSTRKEVPTRSDGDLLHALTVVVMPVPPKSDRLHSLALAPVDRVEQVQIRRLDLEIRGHLHVEVAFALEKIDQISTGLFDQVGIDRALGKDGNQLSDLPVTKKRQRGKF